jgi:hypothetical protein
MWLHHRSAAMLRTLQKSALRSSRLVPRIAPNLPRTRLVCRISVNMASQPEVTIPPSKASVTVSIIDTTSWARKLDCSDLFLPRFPGLDTFDICSCAFLITHNDRHVLFDLGTKMDSEEGLVPSTATRPKYSETTVTVEKELLDILRDGDVDPDKVDAVVWRLESEPLLLPSPHVSDRYAPYSHIRWDYTGNLASFPPAAGHPRFA